ncbi:MAG: hypothetical protein H7281_11530 [Bacteriovorax sp.]|nr:hypothetical protein [Bacteriovorax sp.]
MTIKHITKFKYSFFALVIFLVCEQKSFALNGSYKTYFSESQNPNESSLHNSLTNTFRPKFTWTPNESYTFYSAYALSANLQKKSLLNPVPEPKRDYRVVDLDSELYTSSHSSSSSFLVNQNLDRLYMSYSSSGFNLNIGRAPIAFGSAKIVNPSDVLTPISYQTLDKEERVGVDTIRMNYSLGPLSLIDAGYVVGNKFKSSKSAAFLRLKSNFFETDISTMLMNFQENFLIGVDLARSVGNASAWFESAYVIPKYFNDNDNLHLKNYFRATLGMDYKLTSSIYSYVEYHYNGAGTHDPKKYIFQQTNIAYSEGGVTLQGVHYLIPGMTYEISSLWKVTGQCLFNANDLSIFNNISVEHNFAQDVFIDLGAYIPFGAKTRLTQNSEFGIYPKIIYSSLRFYF